MDLASLSRLVMRWILVSLVLGCAPVASRPVPIDAPPIDAPGPYSRCDVSCRPMCNDVTLEATCPSPDPFADCEGCVSYCEFPVTVSGVDAPGSPEPTRCAPLIGGGYAWECGGVRSFFGPPTAGVCYRRTR